MALSWVFSSVNPVRFVSYPLCPSSNTVILLFFSPQLYLIRQPTLIFQLMRILAVDSLLAYRRWPLVYVLVLLGTLVFVRMHNSPDFLSV